MNTPTPSSRSGNLSKTYAGSKGAGPAVDDVSLDIYDGEFFTLLGPSGCGKTTTLRAIAGLERPDAGEIIVGGRTLFSAAKKVSVPVNDRDVSMVFQSYAIWPHMTVFDNVAFPLQARRRRQHLTRRGHRGARGPALSRSCSCEELRQAVGDQAVGWAAAAPGARAGARLTSRR